MDLGAFDYDLPESLIAKTPATPRDHSRLLVVNRAGGEIEHRLFFQIQNYLRPGDLLVLNNTRVLPARLFGNDELGRDFEVLLLQSLSEDPVRWVCLARPGKKVGNPSTLTFPDGIRGIIARAADGRFEIRFEGLSSPIEFLGWLERHGLLPLPPYIKRPATSTDRETYQTVYAKERGSVAAPTAGLHFTQPLLTSLRSAGIDFAEITLHIGYGTFSPIRAENIEDHEMHEESYEVSAEALEKIVTAKREGRRVIAVGTTSLRALESVDPSGLSGKTLSGRTRIFIRPGFQFQWASGLITNFHLPKSSLYVLVSSFLGMEATRNAYAEAIREGYRFYSYGDAMALL